MTWTRPPFTLTAAASVVEGGSIVYTASVTAPVTGSDLVITLSNGQTITIPVGQSSGSSEPFAVRADDVQAQGDQTLTVGITGTSGGTFEALTTTSTASTVVTDDADASVVTLTAASSVVEGGSIVYTASVTAPVAGSDLVITLSNGQTVTIPVGQSTGSSEPFAVRADDVQAQGDQTLTVGIAGTSGGTFEALTTTSTASTIVTDDADASIVTLTAASSVVEGGSIAYTASVTAPVAGSDLVITLSNGQTVTIPVGQSTGSSEPFAVRADDVQTQGDQTLTVGITGTSGGRFEALPPTSTASTVVTDDADASVVTLTAANSVAEGGSIVYTASVTAPVAGSDLVITLSNGQTITIPVGQSSGSSEPFAVRGHGVQAEGD